MTSGILLIDKPTGLTSARVVSILKKRLGVKRIGHAGTLDPFASGLLICMTEGATRLCSFAESGRKRYSGKFKLGVSSDTDDITGELEESEGVVPDFEAWGAAARSFSGVVEQEPPQYSAVKIKGKRAYALARQGISVSLAPRKVEIDRFELRPFLAQEVVFELDCSKGTYVRAIARDLGKLVGSGCCVSELRRERSHPFDVSSAISLDDVDRSAILPWEELFPDHDKVRIPEEFAQRLLNGDQTPLVGLTSISLPECSDGSRVLYGSDEREGCLGILEAGPEGWRVKINVRS